jgi:hypothetical protein
MAMTAVDAPTASQTTSSGRWPPLRTGDNLSGKSGHLAIPKDETFSGACRTLFELLALDAAIEEFHFRREKNATGYGELLRLFTFVHLPK